MDSQRQGPAALRCISRALDDEGRLLRATPSFIAFAVDDADEPCDRATLLAVLDRYLHGWSHADPSSVPFAARVRATEDCVETPIGSGLWRTAPRLRTYRHVVADPVRAQVSCMTVIELGAEPALLTLRLKLDQGCISEVESLVTRRGEAKSFAPENLGAVDPMFDRSLALEQRSPAHELRALVDAYFDGIERRDGSAVAWHPECWRSLNGVSSVQGPGIVQQFSRLSHIARVDRRYCAIDEERGLVWGIFAFQIPGAPGYAPRTSFIAESFKIAGGRIRAIHAFARDTAYGTRSGW